MHFKQVNKKLIYQSFVIRIFTILFEYQSFLSFSIFFNFQKMAEFFIYSNFLIHQSVLHQNVQ